jgi:hypothetical protein
MAQEVPTNTWYRVSGPKNTAVHLLIRIFCPRSNFDPMLRITLFGTELFEQKFVEAANRSFESEDLKLVSSQTRPVTSTPIYCSIQ